MSIRLLTTALAFLFSVSFPADSSMAESDSSKKPTSSSVEDIDKSVDSQLKAMGRLPDGKKRLEFLKSELTNSLKAGLEKSEKKSGDEGSVERLRWNGYIVAFELFMQLDSAEQARKKKAQLRHEVLFGWGGGSGFKGHWPPQAKAALKALALITNDPKMAELPSRSSDAASQ